MLNRFNVLNDPINWIDPWGLEMYRHGYNTKPLGQQWGEFLKIVSDKLFPQRTPAEIQAAQQAYYKDIAGRLNETWPVAYWCDPPTWPFHIYEHYHKDGDMKDNPCE